MIRQSAILVLIGMAAGPWPAWSQAPDDNAQVQALKVLRETLLEQERRGTKTVTNPPPPQVPTFEQLERLYLDGQITARQFQQRVLEYKLVRPKPVPTTNVAPAVSPVSAPPPRPGATTNAPAPTVANGEDVAAQARLAELEARMDELLRQRTNRADMLTNTASTSTGPKTKRERMDDLLRLLIAGKITQAEYDAQRAKIIAEPDPNKK